MQVLKVTPSSAKADLTMSASRISWKGRTFDSRRDLTFSEIQRRVVWDTVGLLAGTRLGSCNHQFLSQGGRHLSIPSCRVDLRKSECHSHLRVTFPVTRGTMRPDWRDRDRVGKRAVSDTEVLDHGGETTLSRL